jgi:DNA-nicking Smr family endonuclease
MGRKSKIGRDISDEDRDIWNRVIREAVPLRNKRDKAPAPTQKPAASPIAINARRLPTSFHVGELAARKPAQTDLSPTLDEIFAKVSPNMDRRNFDRLRKGRMQVDARIDLHGMTLTQAHPALTGFVRRAHQDGKRLLLVITGKGKSAEDDGVMPLRRGVLRHQVPQWLNQPPLAPLVLQIVPAHQRDGGTGAYYVYLRRHR